MEATVPSWLDATIGTVASVAIALLVVVNGLFAAGVFLGRDRRFVDRWTQSLVVTDAALVLAAFGAPVAGIAIKLAVKGLAMLATLPAKLMPGK